MKAGLLLVGLLIWGNSYALSYETYRKTGTHIGTPANKYIADGRARSAGYWACRDDGGIAVSHRLIRRVPSATYSASGGYGAHMQVGRWDSTWDTRCRFN